MVGEGKELWDEYLEGPRSIYLNIQLSWVIFASFVQHVEGGLTKEGDDRRQHPQSKFSWTGSKLEYFTSTMKVWFITVAHKGDPAGGEVKLKRAGMQGLTSCCSRLGDSSILKRCCRHSGQFFGSRIPRKATIA